MAMTKKDYELVAKALANQRANVFVSSAISCRIIDETIEGIAAHFALMNANFNKDTFMEAAHHGKSCDT
jgi:hypothetical protein